MPAQSAYDELVTTGLNHFVESGAFQNMILDKQALWFKFKEMDFIEEVEGGNQIQVNLLYEANSTFGSYSRYDDINLTPQTGISAATFDWKQYGGSVTIPGIDEFKNSGEGRIVSLLEGKVLQLGTTAKKTLNADSFGAGTANGGKVLTGLALAIEDGAAWSTYGGIDRSVAANAFWRNNWTGVTGVTSFAAVGLSNMRTMYNNCAIRGRVPVLMITTQAIFESYQGIMAVNGRYDLLKRDQRMADAGIPNVMFNETPMAFDRDCTAHSIYFISDSMRLYIGKGKNGVVTPFMRPDNKDAKSSLLLYYMNLISLDCGTNGVINGFTEP